MTKVQIIYDKNIRSLKIKDLILKKITLQKFEKKDLVIVIGGDGFKLEFCLVN